MTIQLYRQFSYIDNSVNTLAPPILTVFTLHDIFFSSFFLMLLSNAFAILRLLFSIGALRIVGALEEPYQDLSLLLQRRFRRVFDVLCIVHTYGLDCIFL